MTERVCVGCGSPIQTDYPDRPGFVPKSALEKPEPVCRRCFRIKNYGEISRVMVEPEQYLEQVSKIADNPGRVLYVLDVFDLAGSMISGLSRLVMGSRVTVLVNKVDLLPKEVNPEALTQWITKTVRDSGIEPDGVLFVSGHSHRGIDEVISLLERVREDHIYVVGTANVGKSTLLNGLLKKLTEREPFTASRVPGTTLGLVSIDVPLPSGRTVVVVDTPGLMYGNRVTDPLCPDCLKVTVPRASIRPRIYQLNPGQTLWLGGYVRFDFVSGPFQPVVCYVSNELPVHRTKLEKAEEIGNLHMDDILKVPCKECRSHFQERFKTQLYVGPDKRGVQSSASGLFAGRNGMDVVLSGLGWITLQGNTFRGDVWVPRGIEVSARPRLIGHLSRLPVR